MHSCFLVHSCSTSSLVSWGGKEGGREGREGGERGREIREGGREGGR